MLFLLARRLQWHISDLLVKNRLSWCFEPAGPMIDAVSRLLLLLGGALVFIVMVVLGTIATILFFSGFCSICTTSSKLFQEMVWLLSKNFMKEVIGTK